MRRGIMMIAAAGWIASVGAGAEATVWRLDDLARIGGAQPEVWGKPGIVDGAVAFDGKADGVIIPANPLAGCTAFTIEVLIRPDEGGGEAQRFFHVQETREEGMRVLLETRTDGKGGWWLDTFLRTTESHRTLIDPQRVHATGKWYWVALRYDGKRMAHFVNGAKELEGDVAFGPMSDGKISIGVRQNRVYWFKGAIREVRFSAAALAEGELRRVE